MWGLSQEQGEEPPETILSKKQFQSRWYRTKQNKTKKSLHDCRGNAIYLQKTDWLKNWRQKQKENQDMRNKTATMWRCEDLIQTFDFKTNENVEI